MVTMSIDLNELKEEVERLNRLLQNPEPGLSTWHRFLGTRLGKIAALYKDAKPADDNPIAWPHGVQVCAFQQIWFHCDNQKQSALIAAALNEALRSTGLSEDDLWRFMYQKKSGEKLGQVKVDYQREIFGRARA